MTTTTTTDNDTTSTESDSPTLNESDRLYFAGLTGQDEDSELPDWFADKRDLDNPTVTTLSYIVSHILPNAQSTDLYAVNPLAETDTTTLDDDFDADTLTDALSALLSSDTADATAPGTQSLHDFVTTDDSDPLNDAGLHALADLQASASNTASDQLELALQHVDRVRDWQAIIDPNRAARAATGEDVKYIWNVPTSSYSIVNPTDIYAPLIGALLGQDLNTEVFGEVRYQDWGGDVTILLAFKSKSITADDVEDAIDGDLYFGFETGYDFQSHRKVYARMLAFDSDTGAPMWNLSQTHSRRHVGNATDEAHERDNDRVPISDWWDDLLDYIDIFQDEFIIDIINAHQTLFDFSGPRPDDDDLSATKHAIPDGEIGRPDYPRPYTIEDFLTLHDFPGYLAQQTSTYTAEFTRDDDAPGSPTCPSVWALYRGVAKALEYDFRGDVGQRLNNLADTSKQLLQLRDRKLGQADRSWNRQLDESDDTDTTTFEDLDLDISSLDDTAIEDLRQKRDAVEATESSIRKKAQETTQSATETRAASRATTQPSSTRQHSSSEQTALTDMEAFSSSD